MHCSRRIIHLTYEPLSISLELHFLYYSIERSGDLSYGVPMPWSLLERRDFVGRVLLFPTRLNHCRFIPERIDFNYDYFLVGVPVGVRGNLGNVLSIDPDGGAGEHRGLLQKCWFNIDQKYYLEPGLHPYGLEGKLHAFLRSKGKDPADWPYAYLVSTPRFLWSTRNIVSWWFLYDKRKNLDALILEVNNSFWERKIVLLHLGQRSGEVRPAAAQQHRIHNLPVHFHFSVSQHKYYRSRWEKDIFVSPFEMVDGFYNTTVRDPCLAGLNEHSSFHSAITLCTPKGDKKIAGVVNSCAKPLDPMVASGPVFAWFLVRWAYISMLSISRIHFQALRAFMTGSLTYYRRPEVRSTNICREATRLERSFEIYFRRFLGHVTRHSAQPIILEYIPSKSANFSPERFQSCGVDKQQPVVLQVRSPTLYTRILEYANASDGLTLEANPNPLPADRESRNLEVSNLCSLQGLLQQQVMDQEKKFEQQSAHGIWKRVRCCALNLFITILRGSSDSFMDLFVYSHLDEGMQHEYQVKQIQYWLQRRVSVMGSSTMLMAYKTGGKVALMRLILAWSCRSPFVRVYVDDSALVAYTGSLLLLYALWVLQDYI
ncbi:hypothetical protein BDW71DRAFT_201176 [Aspergillus fruticulosus]